MKQVIALCAILLFSSTQVQAYSIENILKKAEELDLASQPTWLRLLHYEDGKACSVVLTDEFFLSKDGRNNPKAELDATINAYFLPWGEDGNSHARCKFPARYFWLSQHLELPDYNLREERCQSLEKWGLFNNIQSISILLVSGYLGNPASTFGHALLKLNSEDSNNKFDLFDLTLNFGAMLPEKENPIRYVFRGLLGGYKAAFSDRYFYTQDMVYSRTEFRDMWEYRLALSDDQRTLLNLHIWEVVGKHYRYFFLDKNCAYRLAELADLVIEEELLRDKYLWYFPEQLFNRLKDIDRRRHEAGKANLIESVKYIPSSQRVLYHQLKLLDVEELGVFNKIISDGIDSLSRHIDNLSLDKKILILDSLLAYQQYRIIAEGKASTRERREAKNKILLTRLKLPVHKVQEIQIPELPSPTEGSRPMDIGIAYASEEDGNAFMRLTWSPFRKEIIGCNNLEGDEVAIFDLALGFDENESEVFLDKFDLIRIVNLNTLSVKVADEKPWSWQMRLGVSRVKENGDDLYDGVLNLGVGYAGKWTEFIVIYGMMDLAAHTNSPHARVRPHFGLRVASDILKMLAFYGAESRGYDGEFKKVWGGKLQYQLNNRFAVFGEISNETATRSTVGLSWNW